MSRFYLADLISSINNGQRSHRKWVEVKFCKFSLSVLTFLYIEGFISGFSILSCYRIRIFLKYVNSMYIGDFVLISKPSQRVFVKIDDKRLKQLGVISTTKGLFLSHMVSDLNCGGEFLFAIFFK